MFERHRGESDYDMGYRSVSEWLTGEPLSVARHVLAERLASVEAGPFNNGGTAAVRDYIESLETCAKTCGHVRCHDTEDES